MTYVAVPALFVWDDQASSTLHIESDDLVRPELVDWNCVGSNVALKC